MPVTLGPMPAHLRDLVRAWIDSDRRAGKIDGVNGLFVSGGPGANLYLDEDGVVRMWHVWDEWVEEIPDGSVKVSVVAIAAEHRPELAAWLPRRPAGAADCEPCAGTGSWPPTHPRIQCPECFGLGWRVA